MPRPQIPQLFDQIYDELHRLADGYMRGERPDHTLQPTALVHEAYLRLAGMDAGVIEDRTHFLVLAARAMRRVLVDHARRHGAAKRHARLVTLHSDIVGVADAEIDIAALDRALEDLARADEHRARIVELHFFAGLSAVEVARTLGIAERTAYLHLRSAKAWLMETLSQGAS